MDNLTIRQLRYFEAVAALGHFGRAAAACAISQPAISLQIKELEQTLGHSLFERNARHIRLTAFGATFAERVRPILRSIDDLGDLARASQNGLVGTLRIGVIPTIGPYVLPRIIAELTRAFPDLDPHVRETQTHKLIADLRGGQLDVALVALPVSEPGLAEVALFDETFVLVRPAADAALPVPDGASLAQMRLLLLEEGHCFRDQALTFCGTGSSTPREAMEGSSLATLVQMVASGVGVTLIPEMAVPLETASADVAVAHFPAPEPQRTVGLIWRRATPMTAQYERLAQIIGHAMGA